MHLFISRFTCQHLFIVKVSSLQDQKIKKSQVRAGERFESSKNKKWDVKITQNKR